MKRPSFQWYPKDYLTDLSVEVMTLEEEGAYRRLMDYEWLHTGLPNDMAQLAKLCRISKARFAKLWPAIKPCFKPNRKGTRLIHPRLAAERRKQDLHHKQKSNAGKKGAAARHGDTSESAKTKDKAGTATVLPVAESSSLARSSSSASSSAVTAKEKPPYRGAKRKRRLPDDWGPSGTHATKASELGLDVESEAERFRLHTQANGRTQLDWDASFRLWLSKAVEFGGSASARASQPDSNNTLPHSPSQTAHLEAMRANARR